MKLNLKVASALVTAICVGAAASYFAGMFPPASTAFGREDWPLFFFEKLAYTIRAVAPSLLLGALTLYCMDEPFWSRRARLRVGPVPDPLVRANASLADYLAYIATRRKGDQVELIGGLILEPYWDIIARIDREAWERREMIVDKVYRAISRAKMRNGLGIDVLRTSPGIEIQSSDTGKVPHVIFPDLVIRGSTEPRKWCRISWLRPSPADPIAVIYVAGEAMMPERVAAALQVETLRELLLLDGKSSRATLLRKVDGTWVPVLSEDEAPIQLQSVGVTLNLAKILPRHASAAMA